MRRAVGNRCQIRVDLSSRRCCGGGTGGQLTDPDYSNQLARNRSRPGSCQPIWRADPADFHFGGLWQEPKAGIFRRRRLANRTSPSGAVELCLLEVDGRVSGDGLCTGKKIARYYCPLVQYRRPAADRQIRDGIAPVRRSSQRRPSVESVWGWLANALLLLGRRHSGGALAFEADLRGSG